MFVHVDSRLVPSVEEDERQHDDEHDDEDGEDDADDGEVAEAAAAVVFLPAAARPRPGPRAAVPQ